MSEPMPSAPVALLSLPRELTLAAAVPLFGPAPGVLLAGADPEVVLRADLDRALGLGLGEETLESIARADVPRWHACSAAGGERPPPGTALGWVLVETSAGGLGLARGAVEMVPARRLDERAMGRLLPPSALDVLADVGRFAAARGREVFAVGGLVRDLALGLPFQEMDLDLVADGDAIGLARAWGAARGHAVRAHPAFGTAKCSALGAIEVDLASMRRERYSSPGALPAVEPGALLDDLHRRDFTANALALSLAPGAFGAVVDPFDGWGDLERRVLRVHHPLSFVDDPTRLLRSARYRARLGLAPDAGHDRARALALRAGVVSAVSGVRLLADLVRIFLEADPVGALSVLAAEGVLGAIHPALEDWRRGFERLAEIRRIAVTWPEPIPSVDAAIPTLTALMWDWDALRIESVRRRLQPPGRAGARLEHEIPRARAIAARLGNQHAPRASEVHRLLERVPDALLVPIAALGGPAAASAVRRFVETSRHVVISTSGADLLALGFERGPILGRIQARLRTARLDGEVHDGESELALVRREFLADDPS
ncbi:MAG: hypothetical protein U0610_23740 [bacterium]